jgi:uncharacterized repeat protein (TIGR03803 family)
MNNRRFSGAAIAALVITFVVLTLAPGAWAQSKYKVLHQFNGYWDGHNPNGSLNFDATGNLYSTTDWGYGGACQWHGCGTAFQLTPNSDGSWTENILYSFSDWGSPGSWPMSGLILDAEGTLYGTTQYGGTSSPYMGLGVVFNLTPNLDGTWTENVLHTFTGGSDGAYPVAALVLDSTGNLYGTTTGGGGKGICIGGGCGTVFRLTPNPDGSWTETILHAFAGHKYGAYPWPGSLIFDSAGTLYGTTRSGGAYGYGNIFKLTPNPDGSWAQRVLHQFTGGKDGANPNAGLSSDSAGNLYGTTWVGGANGYGNIFELMPKSGESWTEKVLYQFKGGKPGANPNAGLVQDAGGSLYGTTYNGGIGPCRDSARSGCGTAFKLTPLSGGGWKKTTLHLFASQGNGHPTNVLILDPAGNLFGTTAGADSRCSYIEHWHGACGVVFEITP